MDAAGHDGLDDRAEVLVLDAALDLTEARAVRAVVHRLFLQVALAALVADRAVERVVGEEELHDALARAVDHGRVGLNAHLWGQRPCARSDWLGHLLHLDEAHAAVAGDGKALVEAEARDVHACHLARLDDGRAERHLNFFVVDEDHNVARLGRGHRRRRRRGCTWMKDRYTS